MAKEFLSIDQAADKLRVSRMTVWRLIKAGVIPYSADCPRLILIRGDGIRSDLVEALQEKVKGRKRVNSKTLIWAMKEVKSVANQKQKGTDRILP